MADNDKLVKLTNLSRIAEALDDKFKGKIAVVVEEVEEPVVVEEEVVEEAPVEEAAETFDFGVIAVVAAIVSAAGYAISKKR